MENQKKLVAKMSDPKLSAEKKKAYQEQFQQLTGMVKQFSSKKVAQMEMLKPAEQKAKEKEKERLDRELDLLSSRPDWEGGDEGGVNQALKEQLESLKVKAEQQGIDPAAVLQGGAGRGRGGYGRGRGRGAFGRGGARSLDNRTTKIKVTGVPPADHENVKAHLMQFGEVISAEFKDTEDFGVVHFKNRWEAEKAFVKPPTIDSAPALKFSWLNEPAAAPVIKTEEAPAAADAVNGGAGDAAGGSAEVVAGFDEFEEDDTGDRNWKR
ncbi:hypothetical protein HK097_004249 [Rhizophlyctis rosea]|uniref:RRM domain-containing protein n=1 Tax=Rhizophlyctis rosea TaxID=64517 RepID=A0AAD5S1T1_9FUNG|nr:hypothetical protein HK097_004249 [Rhizophlyctis rosea]